MKRKIVFSLFSFSFFHRHFSPRLFSHCPPSSKFFCFCFFFFYFFYFCFFLFFDSCQFDRSCEDNTELVAALYAKLDDARRHRHVVCSAPESIKSLFLKFVEQQLVVSQVDFSTLVPGPSMRQNKEITRIRDQMMARSDMADALYFVLRLWKDKGVLIMDEVDVLLHPLRSELNFPLGQKEVLPSYRWDIPLFIIDGLFFRETQATCEPIAPEVLARHPALDPTTILKGFEAALEYGMEQHCLQRNPHLVLLDEKFYHSHIKTWVCQWVLLWLHGHFVGAVAPEVTDELLLGYLHSDEHQQTARATIEAGLLPESIQLLNLASDWTRSLMPHCLSKIDRVSFGILSPLDLTSLDPRAPQSRRLLAVPFVGKVLNPTPPHPLIL